MDVNRSCAFIIRFGLAPVHQTHLLSKTSSATCAARPGTRPPAAAAHLARPAALPVDFNHSFTKTRRRGQCIWRAYVSYE